MSFYHYNGHATPGSKLLEYGAHRVDIETRLNRLLPHPRPINEIPHFRIHMRDSVSAAPRYRTFAVLYREGDGPGSLPISHDVLSLLGACPGAMRSPGTTGSTD